MAKLRSELATVHQNCRVFGEILTELSSGSGSPDDVELVEVISVYFLCKSGPLGLGLLCVCVCVYCLCALCMKTSNSSKRIHCFNSHFPDIPGEPAMLLIFFPHCLHREALEYLVQI